jgi:hypothetical protein
MERKMLMAKYNDYPLEQCAAAAQKLTAQGILVYQKWTCAHCGSRQTMADPDRFYVRGVCEECKRETRIEQCNYMVHAASPSSVDALLKDMLNKK